jgi:hypothetical protein
VYSHIEVDCLSDCFVEIQVYMDCVLRWKVMLTTYSICATPDHLNVISLVLSKI